MKKILLILLAISVFSCENTDEKGECGEDLASTSLAADYWLDPLKYSEYTPIEIPKDKLGEYITFEAPFEVKKSGKIYIKDDRIFIGEANEGFHIYDNSDPRAPVQEKFLKTGPAKDLAIREDYFYLNQLNDLVTLKVNLNDFTLEETDREEGVFNIATFTGTASPDGYYFNNSIAENVIVGFSKKENFVRPEIPESTFSSFPCNKNDDFTVLESADPPISPTSDGQGGSFATFVLRGDFLYTVDNRKLGTFIMKNKDYSDPDFTGNIDVGFGIETLSGFGENLFIGSNDAMYIYGLENPEIPVFKSISNHFRACDPVLANEKNAFVTIRGGSRCGGNSNQLKVYDIEDVENPKLLLDKELIGPKGIALYGDYIFVADTKIRVFNISKVNAGEISFVTDIEQNVTDLIIRENHLFAIGDKGIYQYLLDNSVGLKIEILSELVF